MAEICSHLALCSWPVVTCTLLHLILHAVFALQSLWSQISWVKSRLCCAPQAVFGVLRLPRSSSCSSPAWVSQQLQPGHVAVLKPKSLRVQQGRAQGSEFLTWSQEWRRIWRCVFSPDFSFIHRTGRVVWEGIALRTQEWRDSRGLFSFSLLMWRAN